MIVLRPHRRRSCWLTGILVAQAPRRDCYHELFSSQVALETTDNTIELYIASFGDAAKGHLRRPTWAAVVSRPGHQTVSVSLQQP